MDDIRVPGPQTFFPVYHGSAKKGLSEFDSSFAGSGVVSYNNRFGAIFFSSEPEMASYYSDPVEDGDELEMTYVCRITMENPLVLDEEEQKAFHSRSDEISYALSQGHDGLVVKDTIDGPFDIAGDVYVIFDPNQAEIVNTLQNYKPEEEEQKNE